MHDIKKLLRWICHDEPSRSPSISMDPNRLRPPVETSLKCRRTGHLVLQSFPPLRMRSRDEPRAQHKPVDPSSSKRELTDSKSSQLARRHVLSAKAKKNQDKASIYVRLQPQEHSFTSVEPRFSLLQPIYSPEAGPSHAYSLHDRSTTDDIHTLPVPLCSKVYHLLMIRDYKSYGTVDFVEKSLSKGTV